MMFELFEFHSASMQKVLFHSVLVCGNQFIAYHCFFLDNVYYVFDCVLCLQATKNGSPCCTILSYILYIHMLFHLVVGSVVNYCRINIIIIRKAPKLIICQNRNVVEYEVKVVHSALLSLYVIVMPR